jgi:hypothetical protein
MALAAEPPRQHQLPSEAVIHALADAEDVPPESLPVTLWDYVDPEALDSLANADDCTVRFAVEDYDVTVETTAESVSVTVD